MSDLSPALNALARSSHTQLPVHVYFDEQLYKEEQARIFQSGPRYLGHAVSVPEVGDYLALPQEKEGRVLVRTKDGIELISNVCRHRQALMLRGRGNTKHNIVCPLHRWTYSHQGELIGAPHFDHDPCLNLNNYKVRNWNGLLFEDNGRDIAADLAGIDARFKPGGDLDFSGYVLDHVELHECNYNWKTFIEAYLEDYHVDEKPSQGAVWLTYYPTMMVEWYPHVLVVSNMYPQGPQKTLNVVEFYYPEEIAAFEREFIEAQRAAYMETCIEDDEIGERMDAGRRALMERGDNEVGPYQSPMEDGMQHFHEWYRKMMAHPLQASPAPSRGHHR